MKIGISIFLKIFLKILNPLFDEMITEDSSSCPRFHLIIYHIFESNIG